MLDLYAHASWHDAAHHLLAAPASLLLRLVHRRLRPSPAERAAWAAHGAHDVYPTLPAVRATAAAALPGAVVRRLLLWRYALRWDKPRHLGQRETGRQP